MNISTALALEQVSFSAPLSGQILLDQLSFTVQSGTFLGIVGPSGAGKSTLVRLLNRLLEPSSGKIFFQGQLFGQIPVLELRRQVVLVPQEPKLLGMTVADTLAYPLQLLHKSPSEIKAAVADCISRLHLPTDWLERYETQLSLGQRQLVSIARALLLKPAVLVLDEPTSALDLGTANHTLEVLSSFCESQAMTIVMVNHQLEFVEGFATEILYLQGGRMLNLCSAKMVNWGELRQKLIAAESEKVEGEMGCL